MTGSNLIECDQTVLKEMGIKKIGDRVRIFVAIKALRTKAVGNSRKRNRDSLAALDSRQALTPYTPSSAGSPRNFTTSTRDRSDPSSSGNARRWSRHDLSALQDFQPNQRPGSPLAENENMKNIRTQRHGGMSPLAPGREKQSSYFGASGPAKNARPATPNSGHGRGKP